MKNLILTLLIVLGSSAVFACESNCGCGEKEEPVAAEQQAPETKAVESEPTQEVQEIDAEEFIKFAQALKAESEAEEVKAVPAEPSEEAKKA